MPIIILLIFPKTKSSAISHPFHWCIPFLFRHLRIKIFPIVSQWRLHFSYFETKKKKKIPHRKFAILRGRVKSWKSIRCQLVYQMFPGRVDKHGAHLTSPRYWTTRDLVVNIRKPLFYVSRAFFLTNFPCLLHWRNFSLWLHIPSLRIFLEPFFSQAQLHKAVRVFPTALIFVALSIFCFLCSVLFILEPILPMNKKTHIEEINDRLSFVVIQLEARERSRQWRS